MEYYLQQKIIILFLFPSAILFVIGVIALQRYPIGVQQYKTITLGMPAAEKAGNSTGWAPPYNRVPEESTFYVYSLGDEAGCIQSSCGIGGYFIECLRGWISGYNYIAGDTIDYGLNDESINSGREKVITIADKDAKIVGIYPGARIRNLPYIMRNHSDLVSDDTFKKCSDLLPRRWK